MKQSIEARKQTGWEGDKGEARPFDGSPPNTHFLQADLAQSNHLRTLEWINPLWTLLFSWSNFLSAVPPAGDCTLSISTSVENTSHPHLSRQMFWAITYSTGLLPSVFWRTSFIERGFFCCWCCSVATRLWASLTLLTQVNHQLLPLRWVFWHGWLCKETLLTTALVKLRFNKDGRWSVELYPIIDRSTGVYNTADFLFEKADRDS